MRVRKVSKIRVFPRKCADADAIYKGNLLINYSLTRRRYKAVILDCMMCQKNIITALWQGYDVDSDAT